MAIFIVLWLQDVGRVPCADDPALKCLVEFDPDLTKWTPDIIMEYFPKVYAAYSATFGLTLSSDGVFVELSNSNLTLVQLFRDFLQIISSWQHFFDSG